MAKIVSTIKLPVRRLAANGPIYVITGKIAFPKACRNKIVHAPRPFARAVRIYSCWYTSSNPLRVKRAINAIGCAANVSTGKIIYDGPRHNATGNQPNSKPTT